MRLDKKKTIENYLEYIFEQLCDEDLLKLAHCATLRRAGIKHPI